MFSDIRKVYNLLSDDESKYIFEKRIGYSATKDSKFIYDLAMLYVDNLYRAQNTVIHAEVNRFNNKKLYIYGIGSYGHCYWQLIRKYAEGAEILGFVDQKADNVHKQYDMCVISPEDYVHNHGDNDIFIAIQNKKIKASVREYFIKAGLDENRIIAESDIDFSLLSKIYFDPILNFNDHEVFVDAGCFDCKSIVGFIKAVDNKFDKIVSFEPDVTNYLLCKKIIEENQLNAELLKLGLSNKKETLRFQSSGSSSRFSENGDIEVEVDSLDNIWQKHDYPAPTYIKMDIEGAEMAALNGATGLIAKHKPKLAVSIYHKPDDIFEIINYLHKLIPDYVFYIRHYTANECDTVLYAINKE